MKNTQTHFYNPTSQTLDCDYGEISLRKFPFDVQKLPCFSHNNIYKSCQCINEQSVRLPKHFKISNKKCHKHVTNAPKGIGLAQDTFEER